MSLPKAELHPLDLTVHNPPEVQTLAQMLPRAPSPWLGRWKMLVVLLVCAAPVVASYFTYYVLRPEGRSHFGDLIAPQHGLLQDLVAQPWRDTDPPLSQLKGQWLLISTASGACEGACERHLYLQRQLRESLGRDKDRMDWVWLVSGAQAPSPALNAALHDAAVLRVDEKALSQWLAPAQGQQLQDHLYVVDPMGNWMMRFPANVTSDKAKDIRRDLQRLLRASAAWQRPSHEGKSS